MANITGEINSDSISGVVSNESSISGNITDTASVVGEVNTATEAYRSHPELSGRNLPDQHPIGAVTSLQAELLIRPSEVISDEEIMAL